MKKLSIEEVGKRLGFSRAEAYRRSRAGRIFLTKVKEGRQTFYLFDEKKALAGFVPAKDDIRLELMKISVALSAQKKRVDGLIKTIMRPEEAHYRGLIRNKK